MASLPPRLPLPTSNVPNVGPPLRAGVNTGPCITGDADCNGDASSAGPTLVATDSTATDNPALDQGEFAVLVLDFGKDNRRTYTPSEPNPGLAVVGVPSSTTAGVENLGAARVARVSGTPRNGFGAPIPNVTVSVYNYVSGSSTAVGPTRDKPHLELAIRGYSRIPVELAALDTTGSVMTWDPAVACIAVTANLGSIDDGPVGEDSMVEQQNCPTPSPSPSVSATVTLTISESETPLPTTSSSASPTLSTSASDSSSITVSGTVTATASATVTATASVTITKSSQSSGTSSSSPVASESPTGTQSVTRTRSLSPVESPTPTPSMSEIPVTPSPSASPSVNAPPPLIVFTGDIEVDFPAGPGVFVVSPTSRVSGLSREVGATTGARGPHAVPGQPSDSGWTVYDIRFAYDSVSDTAYFGKCPDVTPGGASLSALTRHFLH
jgi:hypothetical protein